MIATKITTSLLNIFYFCLVFLFALALTTLSLARRINSFESTQQPLLVNIDKEDIIITNTISGKIEEVFVNEGDHVNQGDLLVRMEDPNAQARIESLEAFSDNLSARTEANLLRAQVSQSEIRAPRDGVVYKILVGEGANLNLNTSVITLFADDNLRLTGVVNPDQYAEIQKNRSLSAYSPRLEQVYDLEVEGVGRVHPATDHEASKYELILRFAREDEGAVFLEGESLEITSLRNNEEIASPSYIVARFWNQLVTGK